VKECDEKRAKEKAFTKMIANFYIACEKGDKKAVETTLAEQKDLDLINYHNTMRGSATPFMAAAGKAQKEICDFLLEKKASVNAEDTFEWTALNWATSEKNEDMVKYLTDKGGELGAGDMDEDEDSD